MHEVGDSIPLQWRVVNPQGDLVDATVTLTVDRPDGTPVTPTVTRESVGVYSALSVPTQPGRHVVRWAATGALDKAHTDVLNVAPASSPIALISLAEAREHINMSADHTVEDEELRTFIAAASRVVEQYTKQVIARRTIVEDHFLYGALRVALRSAPILSLTSVTSPDGVHVWDHTAMAVDADSGIVSVPGLYGVVRFTFVAGYQVVPENVIKATQIICAHLWQTQRVPTLGAMPGFGGADMAAPVTGRGYLIPNQAAQLLGGRAPNSP